MLRPSEVEVFTEEERASLEKMVQAIDEALKKKRGTAQVRAEVADVAAYELARRYAAEGWSVTLQEDHGTFVIAVKHPLRMPPTAIYSENKDAVSLDVEDGVLNAEGVLVDRGPA